MLSTYGASFLRFGGIVFLIAVLPAAGIWLIVLICFFRWIAAGVSTWLEVAAASPSPRWFCRVGLAIAALLFLLIFQGPLYAIAGALNLATGDITPGQIVSFFINGLTLSPFTTLALVILWAFPLAPGFWRERVARASGAAWAFLDQPAHGLALPRQPPLRPLLALAVGLGWGAVAGILIFIGAMTLARAGQNPIGLLGGEQSWPRSSRRWLSRCGYNDWVGCTACARPSSLAASPRSYPRSGPRKRSVWSFWAM